MSSFSRTIGTKLSIETSKTLLELSKGPLDDYAAALGNSALNAKQLADFLADALKTQLALIAAKASSVSGTEVLKGIEEGTITKSNITLSQALAGAKQATKNINDFTQRRAEIQLIKRNFRLYQTFPNPGFDTGTIKRIY